MQRLPDTSRTYKVDAPGLGLGADLIPRSLGYVEQGNHLTAGIY